MLATVLTEVQVPEALRQSLQLKPGQAVALLPDNGVLQVVPVPTLAELRGILKGADTSTIRERDNE